MMSSCPFDREILQPDFVLAGAHLVEASAGTGKTYNIQNVYARLVMEKGLKVSEIQVMTFTEAATKELKERLHAVLKELQERFGNPKEANDRVGQLIACVPPEKRLEARCRVELALLEFDRAAISTIHGFCQRVLTRYAFDTGVSLASEIEENKEAELNALAEDWWRGRPGDAPAGIDLKTLKTFVHALAAKTEYAVDASDCTTPEGYLLAQAQQIVSRYEADAPNRRKMNFDDLLRVLRNALKPAQPYSAALIGKLRQEFKAALIDEFQDTDPVQYEIFERIFLNGNPNPLFFVGDPKQAIYSFRGGDVFTYLKAKDNPDLSIGTLNVNHRSTSRLVDSVNGMFADENGIPTFGDERISYQTPVTVEKEPDLHGRPLADRPLTVVELPTAGTSPFSAILDVMAEKVIELLNGENGCPRYAPGDLAILTTSNDRNKEIQRLLRQRNVPSVIRHSGNVFSSPVAAELRIVLLAAANPADKALLLAALATVFGGVRLDQLPSPDDPAALEPFLKRFSALHELWQSRGIAAVAAELENSGCRERLARRPEGERLLADLEQIWELAFAAVKKHGPAMESLLQWLTERINAATCSPYSDSDELNETKSEEYARELENDENAVRIMTIHVSKGLQFPVVLLPDCWDVVKKGTSALPAYHQPDGSLVFSLSDEAQQKAREEQNSEKLRLLYVALTRAAERTILFSPPLAGVNQEEPLPRLIGRMQRRFPENPPYEKVAAVIPASPGIFIPAPPASELVPALDMPDFSGWNLPLKGSYSSLTPSAHDEDSEEGRDVDPWRSVFNTGTAERSGIFSVPEGAATGTCWHNVLEKIAFNAQDAEICELAKRELTDSGLMQPPENLTHTVQMIRKVLDFPIAAPDGELFALNSIPWSKRMSEREFNFATANAAATTQSVKKVLEKHWGGDPDKAEFLQAAALWNRPIPHGFMTGFIDLIFQHGEAFYVVDWKSNSLEHNADSFDASGVRKEMANHGYFFQYLLYSVVLHFHLKATLKDAYEWSRHFGGIRYYFLRGIASGGKAPVFADRPSEALLNELGAVLGLEA